MGERSCAIEGCDRTPKARGWCRLHYERWTKHGDPRWEPPEFAVRFWMKVDKSGPIPERRPELGPCWVWMAAVHRNGYGKVSPDKGFSWLAHRTAWALVKGSMPDLELDHLCRRRNCVNPDHLEPVTSGENHHRGEGKDMQTHRSGRCERGHDRAIEGYRRKDQPNGWICRACQRDARRRRKVASS